LQFTLSETEKSIFEEILLGGGAWEGESSERLILGDESVY